MADQDEIRCLRCQGPMVQGFVIDRRRTTVELSTWFEGQPRKSVWTGVDASGGRTQYPIGTYRCQACGYLESYARDEFAAT